MTQEGGNIGPQDVTSMYNYQVWDEELCLRPWDSLYYVRGLRLGIMFVMEIIIRY